MNSTREIVTLQIGDYANHIATHFWNLEWENSRLDNQDNSNVDNDNDLSNIPSTDDINTTNPYKSAKYLKLKKHSVHNNNSNNPSNQTIETNKNINPNICFYSKKQYVSSQNIKNKLNITKSNYVPRSIIFATNGSEGNISTKYYDKSSNNNINNNINNTDNDITTWNNDINIVNQPSLNTNNNPVQYWSDYLLPSIHPKSLFLLDDIHYYSTPFDLYSIGYNLLNNNTSSSADLNELIDDRIRWFIESCDWFQGFQIFSSHYNSFSGFIPSLIHLIYDDYSNKSILLYDCKPSVSNINHINNNNNNNASIKQIMTERYKLNTIISMSEIYSSVSNIIPIYVDNWNQNVNNKFSNTSIIGSSLHHYTNLTRIYNSNIRLNDIINSTVKSSSLKLSMLSSSSTHFNLNNNSTATAIGDYKNIKYIENLLDLNNNQPIFTKLSCLGPITNQMNNIFDKNIWNRNELFGEYTCLNGSNLYNTNLNIVNRWKNDKIILAQKLGSSLNDIDQYINKWKYDIEQKEYHNRLMTKLSLKSPTPHSLQWNLIQNSWKLPSTHPFYKNIDNNNNDNDDDIDNKDNDNKNNDNNDNNNDKYGNNYSIWSSGWSASVIGDNYLNKCAKNISNVIQKGNKIKIFGDVEIELNQHKENLLAWTDAYSPIQMLEID